MVKSLTEVLPATIDRLHRSAFSEVQKLKISKTPFEFVTVPGERTKKVIRLEAVREAMKGLAGIIDVTAFGFHEGSAGEDQVFDQADQVKPAFLDAGRREEITALNEWTTLLGDRSITRWLITVVTKADLWWDTRQAVVAHYSSGDYFKALNGAESLGHSVIEYCSEVHKFYGRGTVSPHFDDSDRVKLRAQLLRQLVLAVGEK
jgi:hypothetical protein